MLKTIFIPMLIILSLSPESRATRPCGERLHDQGLCSEPAEAQEGLKAHLFAIGQLSIFALSFIVVKYAKSEPPEDV